MGEQHLPQFDAFLEQKERRQVKTRDKSREQVIESKEISSIGTSVPKLTKNASYQSDSTFRPTKPATADSKMNNFVRSEELKQKRKILEDQEKTKRVVTKMKMVERMERHEANFLRYRTAK